MIFVLTGGPCAGKSTLLAELARRGFPVIQEAARGVILEGRLTPSRDPLEFQREVLRRQLAWERCAPPGTVFADRGVGDHFGYLEHYRIHRGLDLSAPFSGELASAWEEARPRYGAVFLLERSPRFTPASYRREAEAEAEAIHRAIVEAYRARHPRVVDVAWGPIEERAEKVMAFAEAAAPEQEYSILPGIDPVGSRWPRPPGRSGDSRPRALRRTEAMNLPHALSLLIRRSLSLPDLLDSTVELVAREMGTDVCSIYLLDPKDHRLRLMATRGLDKAALGKVVLALGEGLTGIVVSEMRFLAVEDASTHPGFRYFPETREERFHSFLGVPMAIRNRPVGAVVVQTRDRRKYSSEEIDTLTTISAQLVGMVENARLVNALDRGEEGRRYLDEIRSWNTPLHDVEAGSGPDLRLKGNPASPGVVIGDAAFRGSYDLRFEVRDEPYRGAAAEAARLTQAIERTRADILKIQEAAHREADEEHALIFSSHLLFLNDPTLAQRLSEAIGSGLTAPRATFKVLGEIESQLQEVNDSYIKERVEDIRDLRGRLLDHLLEEKDQPQSLGDEVVVTSGIPPSLVVELKAQGARAIVTERGGLTSHGALLARSMGIPAVTGVPNLLHAVRSGDRLIVDGGAGLVIVRPTAGTEAEYRERGARLASDRVRRKGERDKPASSPDGIRIPLLANIGVAADIERALENGAEGIGLYRTEFPFLIREDFPTREEQLRIYRRVYEAFPEGPINFRVLDMGGDKFLPSLGTSREPNPELGYRSLRILLDHPRVLEDQVQAFLRASAGRPMAILLPMVGSTEELRRAKAMIRSAIDGLEDNGILRDPPVGVMIEVPAAVEIASHLARESAFFSIGSNDLTQFTLAVDRENERVAAMGNPFHPAVLGLVRRTIAAGRAAGIPVGLCGEMAANPPLAVLLAAMGIDSLSMSPNAIPEVKEAIRRTPLLPLRSDLDRILGLPDAAEIRSALESIVNG